MGVWPAIELTGSHAKRYCKERKGKGREGSRARKKYGGRRKIKREREKRRENWLEIFWQWNVSGNCSCGDKWCPIVQCVSLSLGVKEMKRGGGQRRREGTQRWTGKAAFNLALAASSQLSEGDRACVYSPYVHCNRSVAACVCLFVSVCLVRRICRSISAGITVVSGASAPSGKRLTE